VAIVHGIPSRMVAAFRLYTAQSRGRMPWLAAPVKSGRYRKPSEILFANKVIE
jgi:hypothetical protein